MSTTLQESSFLGRSQGHADDNDQPEGNRLSVYYSSEEIKETEHSLQYTPAARKLESKPERQPRVLRRMSGFLVEMEGQNARVAFVEDGKPIFYDLPANNLRNSGIETKNQPFQMDEIELKTENGLIIGYRFKPLAKSSDAYIEALNFDETRKRKRDLILKEFGKA